uniref:(northern house mosquito) hypothetical protein n=1 Tax=Culex pipiens TaxID=7175 RepID=A0A8D8P3T9_CULPI
MGRPAGTDRTYPVNPAPVVNLRIRPTGGTPARVTPSAAKSRITAARATSSSVNPNVTARLMDRGRRRSCRPVFWSPPCSVPLRRIPVTAKPSTPAPRTTPS